MKRLLVIAAVALLVLGAGCGMTSPSGTQAQQEETTTATTTTQGSNPHDTAPVNANLPEGFSGEGIDNVSLVVENHLESLEQDGFQITYTVKDTETNTTTTVVTNGSVSAEAWLLNVTSAAGPETQSIYQTGDTRYVKQVGEDGSETVQTESEAFAVPDGTVGEETLEDVLTGVEPGTPRALSPEQMPLPVNWPDSLPEEERAVFFYQVRGDTGETGQTVHLMVLPTGRIRLMVVAEEGSQISYGTGLSDNMTVTQPDWIDQAE